MRLILEITIPILTIFFIIIFSLFFYIILYTTDNDSNPNPNSSSNFNSNFNSILSNSQSSSNSLTTSSPCFSTAKNHSTTNSITSKIKQITSSNNIPNNKTYYEKKSFVRVNANNDKTYHESDNNNHEIDNNNHDIDNTYQSHDNNNHEIDNTYHEIDNTYHQSHIPNNYHEIRNDIEKISDFLESDNTYYQSHIPNNYHEIRNDNYINKSDNNYNVINDKDNYNVIHDKDNYHEIRNDNNYNVINDKDNYNVIHDKDNYHEIRNDNYNVINDKDNYHEINYLDKILNDKDNYNEIRKDIDNYNEISGSSSCDEWTENIRYNKYVYSSSDESILDINSNGSSNDNIIFDIESDSTSNDSESESTNIPTPVVENSKLIKDICSYSNETIYLLENYNIIRNIVIDSARTCKYNIQNNINLKRIVTFDGYLHGLSIDGILYYLPTEELDLTKNLKKNWEWIECKWSPKDIMFISYTYDSNNIWVQTNNYAYLNTLGKIIKYNFPININRIYGKDIYNYIDLNRNTNQAIIYPSKENVYNVYYCLLSYHNKLYTINMCDKNKYKFISIVNWTPYFISN